MPVPRVLTALMVFTAGCTEPPLQRHDLVVTDTGGERFAAWDQGNVVEGGTIGQSARILVAAASDELAVASDGDEVLLATLANYVGDPDAPTSRLDIGLVGTARAQLRELPPLLHPRAVFDGEAYVLAWDEVRIGTARVSQRGEVLFRGSRRPGIAPSLALVGGEVVLGSIDNNVFELIRLGDAAAAPIAVATGVVWDAVAGGADGMVAAWLTLPELGERDLVVQRFDRDLQPIGDAITMARISWNATVLPRFAIAGDPTRFAVMWVSGDPDQPTAHARVYDGRTEQLGASRRLGPGDYPALTAHAGVIHAHWMEYDAASGDDDLLWSKLDDAGASAIHRAW